MSNRPRLRHREPDRATLDRVRDDLRCWSCAAEPKLTFTARRGLAATITHRPDCRQVPPDAAAEGRTVHTVEPVVYEAAGVR